VGGDFVFHLAAIPSVPRSISDPVPSHEVNIDGTFNVLEAFRQGVDGVLVTGCHIGDCHYITGNHACEKRVKFLKETMGQIGMDARRLRLEWVSASEGANSPES
jgi:coenzyme F420-reducing hydrogenase delta subunit